MRWGVYLLLVGGGVAALVSVINGCGARERCRSARRCIDVSRRVCGFVLVDGRDVDVQLMTPTTSNNSKNLLRFLQGPCAPGDTLHVSRRSGSQMGVCTPQYPYPNAYNTEIEKRQADLPHQQACGRWIDSGTVPASSSVLYRSHADWAMWARRVRESVEETTRRPETAVTPVSKFRVECIRTAYAGSKAMQAAAQAAYAHLNEQMGALSNKQSLLRGIGTLAGHYCESPVSFKLVVTGGGGVAAVLAEGAVGKASEMARALNLLGIENGDDRALLEDAERALRSGGADGTLAPEDRAAIYSAATGHASEPSNGDGSELRIATLLTGLDAGLSSAYLRGLCALCSISLHEHLQWREPGLTRHAAPALGRVSSTNRSDVSIEEAQKDLEGATGTRLSHLHHRATGVPEPDCSAFTDALFPDEVDGLLFDATVPGELYTRLEALFGEVRSAMVSQLGQAPLLDAIGGQAAQDAVRTARVRIEGAPRESWAGLRRSEKEASFESSDSVFVMALKQARATFLDRAAALATEEDAACEMPPLYTMESTAANAYALRAGKSYCVVLMLGIAKRPWMDAEYDDESILARVGSVLAHELAHIAHFATGAKTAAYAHLVREYPASIWPEAVADIAAALAVTSTSQVGDQHVFIKHFCQLWCARLSPRYVVKEGATHPPPNERCNALAASLSKLDA